MEMDGSTQRPLSRTMGSQRVAVIGAGPAGLASIKSLLEEGFDVTGFERTDEVGGVWTVSNDPTITSVSTQTKAQLSKFMTPFSDYPHKDDFPRHATAADLGQYYCEYADHFGLKNRIVFNATISSIKRDENDSKWLLQVAGEVQHRTFDKVVYAIGTEVVPKYPRIDKLEEFQGVFIHGQAYKRPEDFRDMRVLVVGAGNTGADCAVELAPHASKVFLSHRRGAVVIPRLVDGQRFDKFATWKATRVGFWLGRYFPSVNLKLLNAVMGSAMKKAWGDLEDEYRFERKPEYVSNIASILINDSLVPGMRAGHIDSVHGVRRIVGSHSVEMDDGSTFDNIDTIIACTGYSTPFDMLKDGLSFASPTAGVLPQPDLYQNIFALQYPDSLACLNFIIAPENAAGCRELAAMAIAQVWAGKSRLPPHMDMKSHIQKHQEWYSERCMEQPIEQIEGLIEGHSWLMFVHQAAGTGLYERLGWTWLGWWFFFCHPLLYFTLGFGVNTPHMWRLFETGKRRAWDGALGAILDVNRQSQRDLSNKADGVKLD